MGFIRTPASQQPRRHISGLGLHVGALAHRGGAEGLLSVLLRGPGPSQLASGANVEAGVRGWSRWGGGGRAGFFMF